MVAATPSQPPPTPDARFPNLRADVIAGYLNAPDTMVAEVIDGELSVTPRPRRQHARAEPCEAIEFDLATLGRV
jgi:hypothetical protein